MHNSAAPIRLLPGKVINMTKTSKTNKTIKVAGKTVKASPVRRRKVETPTPVVVETAQVAEAPVVEAPVAEATPVAVASAAPAHFTIPDLGVTDLLVSREGFKQLPGKTWHRLTGRFDKQTIRQAIAAMAALELRLPVALELVTWPSFRPHMVAQLAAVAANQDVKIVLEWVWNNQGFTWREAYEAFPRAGYPGCTATKAEIGKFNKLVSLLDALRKEGKTSIRSVDLLAQACHLLGWIK